MPSNWYMLFVAALFPLIVGAIYYHPKVAGTAWMNSNKFKQEDLHGANMGLIFGLTYFFSILLAFAVQQVVIHQSGVFQTMMPGVMESGSETQKQFNELMSQYGNNFRSFGHGALHGVMMAIFTALPILGINALFERRGAKYIFIHLGYWIITLGLMGGLLCQVLKFLPAS